MELFHGFPAMSQQIISQQIHVSRMYNISAFVSRIHVVMMECEQAYKWLLKETNQASPHFIQTTDDSVRCLSFTCGTVKQMARRRHGSKMNGWADECWPVSVRVSARGSLYAPYSLCAEEEELLLQVAVDFEAVVARIRNHDMSVGGESESLRAVQRVCWGVDVGEEGAAAIEHLG